MQPTDRPQTKGRVERHALDIAVTLRPAPLRHTELADAPRPRRPAPPEPEIRRNPDIA